MDGYISEVQMFEGFVGAFAAYIAFYLLRRNYKSKNIGIVAGLTFLISWVFRKIFVNNYSFLKKQSETKKITRFLTSYNKYAFLFLLCFTSLTYNTSLKKISNYHIVIYFIFIFVFLKMVFDTYRSNNFNF